MTQFTDLILNPWTFIIQIFFFFSFSFLVWSENQHIGWIMSRTYCNRIRNDQLNLQSIYINHKEIRRSKCLHAHTTWKSYDELRKKNIAKPFSLFFFHWKSPLFKWFCRVVSHVKYVFARRNVCWISLHVKPTEARKHRHEAEKRRCEISRCFCFTLVMFFKKREWMRSNNVNARFHSTPKCNPAKEKKCDPSNIVPRKHAFSSS